MKAATSRIQPAALVVIAVCLTYMTLTSGSGRESVLPEFTSQAVGAQPAEEAQLKWEPINTSYSAVGRLYRSKIPGGWLVHIKKTETIPGKDGVGAGSGLTFVPDPMHTWDGSSLPVK